MTTHKDLADQSNLLRESLREKLLSTCGNDFVVPYTQIARAFPSSEPNPRSFDDPLIDREAIQIWAKDIGFYVQIAHEIRAADNYNPVRLPG